MTIKNNKKRRPLRPARRWLRTHVNRGLAKLVGTPHPRKRPLDSPETILVVRLNKRLGNIMFLTPMLQALAYGCPKAHIDVLIQNQSQASLLKGLPNIRHVYCQPSKVGAILRLARQLRRQRYGLVIDPETSSAGNRLGTWLAKGKQVLGYAGPDQWLCLTHAASRPKEPHCGLRSMHLLNEAITNIDFGYWPYLRVAPSKQTQSLAAKILEDHCSNATAVVGFFTNATGKKHLGLDWWCQWIEQFKRLTDNSVQLLQIRAPEQKQPLVPGISSIQEKSLETLAAILSRLTVFVAADGGPMHLAAAAGTPTVGLFQATDPSLYAPLGAYCTSFSKDQLEPKTMAVKVFEHLEMLQVTTTRTVITTKEVK